VLSTDENDDVVRVIDVSSRQVTHVISLASGANPDGIAVNAAGTRAVVAEPDRGKAAIIDLASFSVVAELATGGGSVSVAIGGTQAVVVNQDGDSVSIIDLNSNTVQKTVPVGRGPKGAAVDGTAHLAYVTNENDGTISVVDLTALSVTRTISLGTSVRPESIALIPGAGVAFVTAPGAGPSGQVLLVNLTAGTVTSTLSANPDRSGGSSDVVFFNSKVYFANQTGGKVSVLPVNASGAATGPITTIPVDLGARALAIDTKDNLLLVSNEGSGTLAPVDLASNKVVARINALKTNMNGDDGDDDYSDHDNAGNAPTISKLSPTTGKVGTAVQLTIIGTNLTGATGVVFINPSSLGGYGHGKGQDDDNTDSAFTVTNIQVTGGGTQLTAAVAISSSAKIGPRLVKVKTPNGETSNTLSATDTFTVTQ
jgi:YVTN family beta-propeller protein